MNTKKKIINAGKTGCLFNDDDNFFLLCSAYSEDPEAIL